MLAIDWSSRKRRPLVITAALGCVLFILMAFSLDAFGKSRPLRGTYDAIVVAGCRVLPNGQASPALERRVHLAVEQWKLGKAPVIVLTGGVGTYPPSEAEASAQVARGLGVPDTALILEARSASTRENALFARTLTKARRILLVTDSYHVYRARWVFRQHFDEVDAVGSLAPPSTRIVGALREVLAVVAYRLRALVGGYRRAG